MADQREEREQERVFIPSAASLLGHWGRELHSSTEGHDPCPAALSIGLTFCDLCDLPLCLDLTRRVWTIPLNVSLPTLFYK